MGKTIICISVAVAVLTISGGIIYKKFKNKNNFSYLDECFI